MPVKDVIRKRQINVTLGRPASKTVAGGYAQAAALSTSTIKAHVQPLSPKEKRDLPPGQNAIDWRNVWSYLSELKINDRITTGGVTYLIKNVIYWDEGEFWQAQGSKVSDTI